jgi:hypothetical protein
MTYTKIKNSRELGVQKVPNLPDWVKETNELKDDIDTVQTNLTTEIGSSAVGSTSLATGALTGAVSHGLLSQPVAVILTPESNEILWVSGVSSTEFIVNRATGPAPATVYYLAEI